MKQPQRFMQKKIFVLGLARTGYHLTKLLLSLGNTVVVNDARTEETDEQVAELRQLGATVVVGSHPSDLLDGTFDWLIKNPGIPYTNAIVQQAQTLGIPVITDVEVAGTVAEARIIGITGTNGKTTTTTLIANMINAEAGRVAHLAGNIGIPATTVAQQAQAEDTIVMELSSFQLKGVQAFHPHIVVIPNISEAHIDYHGTREDYVQSKRNILNNLTPDDYVVYLADSAELAALVATCPAQAVPFSRNYPQANGASIQDDWLVFRGEKVLPLATIKVPGEHNQENILAALSAAKLTGVSNEAITHAVADFRGVIHRTQFVAEVQGRRFYNDAKATNIIATQTALRGFANESVVLIAGGLDRGNGFEDLVPDLAPVRVMVVYGETKDKLYETAKQAGIAHVARVNTLEEAVVIAYGYSREGEVVLLSPACASWDQFANFEQRGTCFIAAVEQLAEEATR